MNDFRCSKCKKLLGKIEGKAEIQCPRCKTMNVTRELFESYFIGTDENGKKYPKEGAIIPMGKTIGITN